MFFCRLFYNPGAAPRFCYRSNEGQCEVADVVRSLFYSPM